MSYNEVPIGALFDVKNGATPASGEGGYWDGDIPWVTPADLGALHGKEIVIGSRSISQDGYANCGTQMVPVDSIILSTRAPIGYLAISKARMCFNQGCRGLIPRPAILAEYGYWALLARKAELEAAGQGTTFIELGSAKLRSVRLPLPDLATQKSITAFLNRETARIDQLIAKKERFQKVIDAKRKALAASLVAGSILHGDDPKGITGWFGQLPSHWKVRRARLLFRECIDPSQEGSEELLSVSHITGVTARADKDVNMFLAETLEGYKLVQPDDLVVNTMWAWMGAIGVSAISGCASPSYAVYRPQKGLFRPEYLDLLVRSLPFVAEVNRRSKGVWASRLRLYPDAFLDIPFPVPPIEEQVKLVNALTARLRREESIAAESERSISLLKERRAALISAAVTGQIDVQAKSSARTAKPDHTKFRVIVGAEIIHRHQGNPKFGHVKLQKLMFLAEAHTDIRELQGNYLREAAGPYDRALIEGLDRSLEVNGFYRVAKPEKIDEAATYMPLAKAGKHSAELRALLGTRTEALANLINLLSDFDKRSVEAIATLYAVWNDAMMDGQKPNDAAIINGVLTEWHSEKGEKFKEADLRHWLDWMKRNKLIPRGVGPKTTTGRLFV
jgi:restriction endonuclease S subunit